MGLLIFNTLNLLSSNKSASFLSYYIKNACNNSFYVSDILIAQLRTVSVPYL